MSLERVGTLLLNPGFRYARWAVARVEKSEKARCAALALAALIAAGVGFVDAAVPGGGGVRNVGSLGIALGMVSAIWVLRWTGDGPRAVHVACAGMLVGYVLQFSHSGQTLHLAFVLAVPVVAVLFGGVRVGASWIVISIFGVLAAAYWVPKGLDPGTGGVASSRLESGSIVLMIVAVGCAALWREALAERARLRKLESERELVAEKMRFTTLAQFAYDVVLEAKRDGRIVDVGPGLMQTLGYRPNEVLGAKQSDFIHPEDAELLERGTERTSDGGRRFRVELRLRHADGSWVWTRAAGGGYMTDGEFRWLYALRNIDREKENERHLREAQQLQSLGELAGGIAHDFNNLLTVIQGYAALLDDEDGADEIRDAASRAAELTSQLLAFGRQQGLHAQRFDLNELIGTSQGMLQSLAREDVSLVLRLAPSLPAVEADPGHVHRVLVNLATNARDAMPDGGTLRITTTTERLSPDAAEALGVNPGTYVLMAVADNGTGMESEVHRRAFEPFFTTKEVGRGTGLGLSSVLGAVEQSGGTVRIDSRVGVGTTVRVYLPSSSVAAEEDGGHPVEQTAMATVATSRRVLVVEDEPSVRRLVEVALASAGHEVATASDGDDALSDFDPSARPDLLVTDVIMPSMRGPDLAERLRRLHPELKVLFMSGYHDGEIRLDLGSVRDTAFLPKPFRPSELLAAVEELLDPAPSDERAPAPCSSS